MELLRLNNPESNINKKGLKISKQIRNNLLMLFLAVGGVIGIQMVNETSKANNLFDFLNQKEPISLLAAAEQGTDLDSENPELDTGSSPDPEIESQTINLNGTKYTYKSLVSLFHSIVSSENSDYKTKDIENILGTYSIKMLVENQFDSKLNIAPFFEDIHMSDSYGLSQVNAFTSLDLALKHKESFLENGLLKAKDYKKLENPNVSESEIVNILKLQEKSNIIYGFLAMSESVEKYAKNTNPKKDPYGFKLALSAYAGGLNSPSNAKTQTLLNEIILLDQDNTEIGISNTLGNSDGIIGPKTSAVLKQVLNSIKESNDPNKNTNFKLQKHLETKLKSLNPNILKTNPKLLEKLIKNRYSTAMNFFKTLEESPIEYDPDIVKSLKQKYIDERDEEGLNMLSNFSSFKEHFPIANHRILLEKLAISYKKIVSSDNKYEGVVPTFFRKGTTIAGVGSDDMNIIGRIDLAQKIDHKGVKKSSPKKLEQKYQSMGLGNIAYIRNEIETRLFANQSKEFDAKQTRVTKLYEQPNKFNQKKGSKYPYISGRRRHRKS